MRRPLVGTNLKMHLTSSALDAYLARLRPRLAALLGCEIFVLPSFTGLWIARARLAGSGIGWGGQDLSAEPRGAFTGETSAEMLADLGCTYVQVGHAERRRDHAETDQLVRAKVGQAVRHGLTPIVCVGERRPGEPRRAIEEVVEQLSVDLGEAPPHAEVIVAYEPVWAIGEGASPASVDHIATVHDGLRRWLASVGRTEVPVIYGGSVDEEAAQTLVALPAVDGLYVGRAALDPERFARIAEIVESAAAGRTSPRADPGRARRASAGDPDVSRGRARSRGA